MVGDEEIVKNQRHYQTVVCKSIEAKLLFVKKEDFLKIT